MGLKTINRLPQTNNINNQCSHHANLYFYERQTFDNTKTIFENHSRLTTHGWRPNAMPTLALTGQYA